MKRPLFFFGAIALNVLSGAGCGSNNSVPPSPAPDAAPTPTADAALIPDACACPAQGVDGGRDASPQDAALIDAGPKCAATPTLLVSASTWALDGALGIESPSVAISATDVYYVVDELMGCNVVPPNDGGPPPIPDGGCGGWTGSIWKVPIRGGASSPVVTNLGYVTPHFVVTAESVVFAAYSQAGAQSTGPENLFSIPLAGGSAVSLAATEGATGFVTADGTHVYFNDSGGIKSVPFAGGSVQSITTDVAFSFVPIGGNLILAGFSDGTIQSVPITGGSAMTIATNQPSPLYPLACGSDVCWANAGDLGGQDGGLPATEGSIAQVAPGGSPTTLAAGGSLFEPTGLSFDGTDFFATAGGGPIGILTKTPAAGGTPATVAEFTGSAGLALDESCVYWADVSGGVYSVAKSANGPFIVK